LKNLCCWKSNSVTSGDFPWIILKTGGYKNTRIQMGAEEEKMALCLVTSQKIHILMRWMEGERERESKREREREREIVIYDMFFRSSIQFK
jgi:hypothetical protein